MISLLLQRRSSVIVAVGALMVCACTPPDSTPHIVLISIDTLRADVLEPYGSEAGTSPRIAALADDAYVFQNAHTHSPNTLAAHASMLTGIHPISHGATENRPLSDSIETLPESLQQAGYQTAAFATHADWLSPKAGLDQGFAVFESRYQGAERNTADVLEWLDSPDTLLARVRGEPIFLFVHYYDVHSDWNELPYESDTTGRDRFVGAAPTGFRGCRNEICSSRLLERANQDPDLLSESEVEWIRGLYSAGVADMDRRVGELLDALWRRGLYDKSWIILTSDHGEEFREHGELLHTQPYRETSRIPLIIRPPGGRSRQDIKYLVGHVDLMPTILEITGAARAPEMQGESLLGSLHGDPSSGRSIHFDSYGKNEGDDLAIREGHFSLVLRRQTSEVELYDLRSDPSERTNVAADFPEVVERLSRNARAFRERQIATRSQDGADREASAAERARLRALGYGD